MKDSAASVAAIMLILGIGGIIALVVLMIVAWCKIFRKADIHPGKFFIPVYGGWLAWDIADCGGLYIATFVISVISSFITSIITTSATRSSYGYYRYESSALNGVMVVYIITAIICTIFQIIFCSKLARAFGKSGGFAAGLIFLNPIFIMILGFGSAQLVYRKGLDSIRSSTETWECKNCGAENPASRMSCRICGKEKP